MVGYRVRFPSWCFLGTDARNRRGPFKEPLILSIPLRPLFLAPSISWSILDLTDTIDGMPDMSLEWHSKPKQSRLPKNWKKSWSSQIKNLLMVTIMSNLVQFKRLLHKAIDLISILIFFRFYFSIITPKKQAGKRRMIIRSHGLWIENIWSFVLLRIN